MGLSRRLLFRSAIWEIARPRHPLTAGHLLVRLSDPSTGFAEASAADWLVCHNLARQALSEILGVHRCVVMFAHRWHPLGSAIGEPVAESSTPTFHLFGRWDGETTTPGRQLALPAHRRAAAPDGAVESVDAGIRESLRRNAPQAVAGIAPQPGSAVVDVLGVPLMKSVTPGSPAGIHHTVLEPASGAASITDLEPPEILSIGLVLESLPTAGGVRGYSCVAVDAPSRTGVLRIHAVGRSAAEEENPLEVLLDSPEVSLALL
ncbi:hypothetical protein ACIQC5_01500 [Paenarthrobacter sp. NPDC092416]|uniref:hypothetical protein n=1 Tax=Paenarthrobacter sp. NPDC092416 TaxID=3364386 RepID=UPI0037F90F95